MGNVLELHQVSKHFRRDPGAERRRPGPRGGRGARPDGRQRRRQVDAGQDHRRQLSADRTARSASRASRSTSTSPSRRAQKGIEVVYQDLALCDNLTAAANVFLGREVKRRVRALHAGSITRRWRRGRASCSPSSSPRRGRATSCGRCRAGSGRRWRSRAPACPRPSIVLMDEPTAAISRAAGRRGARPHPASRATRASRSS